jgi:aminopeptidase-like protein
MPIDWESVGEATTIGQELLELMRELYPLPRSLTGPGVRATLDVLRREVPLELIETPSGTAVFDWVVPREWTIHGAYIEDATGARVLDLADSTLHVLGYSTPIDATVSLEELRAHVFTHPDDPELVPYRTSYWEEQWGFCMSRRSLDALTPGDYHVVIDSALADGSLTSGELLVEGQSEDEFLVSTYVCHPALANDNLSGVVVLWALARILAHQRLAYSYRLLWSPGTLGPLCFLQRNRAALERIRNGLAISCVGDPGPLRYKRSRRGEAPIDRAAALIVAERGGIVQEWAPTGGDERQFCSPGFDLPVGTFSRTPHGLFPAYHSSADDLTLVGARPLGESVHTLLALIDAVETNLAYVNRSPYGEPQLGRRGLYQPVPDGSRPETPLLWVLNLSDGGHDLLEIAQRSGLPYAAIRDAASLLEQHGLLSAPG